MNIAITGRLRSGKDAIAAYLVHKYAYQRFAFGDELKRYANEIFNVSAGAKPRELYQWFGEMMRERDPDVWVRKCFDKIRLASYMHAQDYAIQFVENPFHAVISDLRLPDEYDKARAEGYVIIRVVAPDGARIDRAVKSADTFSLRDLTHDTESHVDGFDCDFEVVNNAGLTELYAKIDAIMAELNEKDSAK